MELVTIIIIVFILLVFPAVYALRATYNCFYLGIDTINKPALRITEVTAMVINPGIFLLIFDTGQSNNCCGDTAFFSPEHRLTIYVLIGLCAAAYLYSSYRSVLASPVIEVLLNALLLAGIALNVFIIIQSNDEFWFIIPASTTIILLILISIVKNQRLLRDEYVRKEYAPTNLVEYTCLRFLQLNTFVKFPLLLILCVPLICLVSLTLYILGQRPDSAVRAFTDTYRHGLSQLDYMCNNVDCGGHYLCSVAAKGHKNVVKPVRLGERNGNLIICNRQLLISNAFEELLEERWPVLHRRIRKRYDRVGDYIQRHYHLFNIKLVSDSIYFLMKPAEWFFLFILYMFDKHPENRINRQYLPSEQKQELKMRRENFF